MNTRKPCYVCERTDYLNSETVQLDDARFTICETCTRNTPGKFEGEPARTVVLWALTLNGFADAWLSDESYGYLGRVGKYLVQEDDQGFVTSMEFSSADAAQQKMNSYEDDGFGASEDDAWISLAHGWIDVSFAGEHLGRFETERRARAAVSVAMRKTGYFPNVWLTGEHGPSVRRIEVW
jgi:hypothetical protein